MGALISSGIKNQEGKWVNYTISVNEETDQYGNNVSMYVEQTKEERDAKAKRTYIGNGKVFWTDGRIQIAKTKQDLEQSNSFASQNPTPSFHNAGQEVKQSPPQFQTAPQPNYFTAPATADTDDLPF